MAESHFLRNAPDGAVLEVYVQPKASRNELAGVHEDCLKIRLTAPPVEGEANKECVKFLSKILAVPKSSIEIIQGQKARRKSLLFRGASADWLRGRLNEMGVS
jgi:uncharacterized protein (TIGR00251 family)